MTEPRPVFFLTHQFFGLRPRDTELCDELARLGYVAVAPDCFKGQTTGVCMGVLPNRDSRSLGGWRLCPISQALAIYYLFVGR